MYRFLKKQGYIIGNRFGRAHLLSNITNYIIFFIYFVLSMTCYLKADNTSTIIMSINLFYSLYLINGYFLKRDKIIDALRIQGKNSIGIPQIEDIIGIICIFLFLIVVFSFAYHFFFHKELEKAAFAITGIIPLFISIMEETFNTIKRLYAAEIV